MRRVVVCFGTRPEAIKLGPVVAELRALGVQPELICTGQHWDLLRGTPAESDLKDAYSLRLRSDGDVESWSRQATSALYDRLPTDSLVVVQGDTMSAYACALAAKELGLPVAHVEAGIRSHHPTEPNPEEYYRTRIGQLAELHFAPTEQCRRNLEAEHVPGTIHVTGNTVVSALARYASLEHVPEADNQIVVTLHRREFTGLGETHVRRTIQAIAKEATHHPSIRFLYPMHPTVLKVLRVKPRDLPVNCVVTPPLAYGEMVTQVRRSLGVMTDSGGLQEEAATLGVPCAVLRNVTDRPESVSAGMARLFPPTPDGARDAVEYLTNKPQRTPLSVYGSAESAREIAFILKGL